MTNAERYREAYAKASKMETLGDWLELMKSIDPDAGVVKRDLGVYIEFTDGSTWRLGAADTKVSEMGRHDTN